MSWLPPGVIAEHLIALLGALAAAALATRAGIAISRRASFVSTPRADRWKKDPVPLGGGVSIYLVIACGLGFISLDLLLAASLVFALGLIDDLRGLSPPVKLVVQTVAACWMVAGPLDAGPPALLFTGPLVLVLPLTVAWYVGMTNSVNLLDNMDGSAAGVAAIAAGFIYVLAVGGHQPDPGVATGAAVVAGAALGFLIFNFPPARVFMGDAGSLPLGFVLAGLAIDLPRGEDTGVRELAVAAFILGIPLFDTALVWLSRRAARRPFLQGGKDHTTHRLVALGLSERRTVLTLYGAAATLGGLGIAVARGGLGIAVITAVVGGIVFILLGVFLGDVPVYEAPPPGETPAARPRQSPAFLYGVELLVDVGILSAAWLGAYALRFDPEHLSFYLTASALPALPFVIAFKVSALLFFRLYRGFWRTIEFNDVVAIAKAVSLASLLIVVAATAIQRFENYSRGVVLIDWLLTFVGVAASRSALRVFRDALAGLALRPRRVALLGPEALRQLVSEGLTGTELVLVLEGDEPQALIDAAKSAQVELVVVAGPRADDDPLLAALTAAGLEIRRLQLSID